MKTQTVSDVVEDKNIPLDEILDIFEGYGYGKEEMEDFLDSDMTDISDAFPELKTLLKGKKRKPKSLDAIKDNFTPPGAKGEKKRKIRASDNPDWIWDNEDVAKRFMATPYLNANYSKDMSDEDKAALKENYKAYKKMSIDDFLKSKDFQPFYEYVGEDEEVEPNNYTSKSLYGDGEQNPYTDLDKLLDEWDKEDIDTNDNGKIEEDEMADFQKSLDDYASKNKKGREDIPARYRK